MLLTLVMYLVLGAAAGIVAGLFGIGGGILIVPVLVFSFSAQGMSADVLTHAAVATSLATIIFTSVSSIKAHHSRGAVRWDLFKPLAVGIAIGAVLGAFTADLLSGPHLQIIIGVFAFLVACQMAFGFTPKGRDSELTTPTLAGAGGFIGWGAAIFGIGGGTLTVPFLTWKKISMQQAVATSAACGLPIAVMGAVTNIYTGWNHENVAPYSLGYIYLPAFAGIVISSSLFAKLGAKWAHSLPGDLLKKIFAAFLFIVSMRFLLANLL
ncbi:sulfite exporter TauE/SafE family protein [Neptunomonas phycophila]|jgi:uncharacterized membrane protein YfcA|uniref:Probable membrane transporter protein n=1 Tax=Neptunomonas phycophila TaxID=1572645 RepID=A0AAW7XJ05_9GAMM|nr:MULTISPECIES: sulfite exporter TauE/SafE family protein [Neptunomonas]MBT3145522.1 sulfite exporter TauE/SafE family protein [Neptunomonas phycophila]MDN2660007.1 sulfite exporter TauE/SafE family protein [Neptunomonas sp. CHC150]MDO6453039.1 sulfite exporter TauE/SafE family protein [Neptunomonas phycophila]MDO6469140.1 sulfite exporter TauE/SafE family protein [Neptunomonas phycophila]MDO6784527.1 sulfite exporter TauE/SafE family protein [Neptunomonas phycophila]